VFARACDTACRRLGGELGDGSEMMGRLCSRGSKLIIWAEI